MSPGSLRRCDVYPAMLAETCKRVEIVERKVYESACKMTDNDLCSISKRLESIEAMLKVLLKHALKDGGK